MKLNCIPETKVYTNDKVYGEQVKSCIKIGQNV